MSFYSTYTGCVGVMGQAVVKMWGCVGKFPERGGVINREDVFSRPLGKKHRYDGKRLAFWLMSCFLP